MLHPLTGQPIDPNTELAMEPSDESAAARLEVSDLLMAIGKGLFLVFLGYLIVDSLPLQLLVPGWQLAFVGRVLSIGSIALVGFACIHLAVILNPANRLYSKRLGMLRRWAMVAAIGFLLLIPLQGYATWRSYSSAKSNQQNLIRQADKRLAPIKKAVESATSVDDLQQQLSRLGGVNAQLTPDVRSRPLEEVKKNIIANLERSENLYANRLASATGPSRVWAALQSAARTLVASLGYFIAFAAGAQPPRSSQTLSDILALWMKSPFNVRRRRRSPLAP
jgi:hypothetical protein